MFKALWKVAPKYVPPEGLKALDKYKYSADDHSILKKLFLGRYWDWSSTYLPLWMAYVSISLLFVHYWLHYVDPTWYGRFFYPFVETNLNFIQITLIGFLCLLSNFLLAFFYCPSVIGCTDVPNWLFYYVAISLFVYQTMDNIDGKQARRTNSSSPLGELFDHGCDSLFLLLTGFPFFSALRTNGWLSFVFLTEGVFAFYFSHWEEYHTGKLIMGTLANPTEIQYAIMFCFVVAGYSGPEIFEQSLQEALPSSVISWMTQFGLEGLLPWQLNSTILLLVVICISLSFFMFARDAWAASIKNGDHILAPLFRLLPLVNETLLLLLWIYWSRIDLLNTQTAYILSMHGILFSYLCDQLLLARICHLEYSALNPILIIPILGVLNVSPIFSEPLVDESIALPVLFGVFFVIYCYFILSVVYQFAEYLNIQVFRIPYIKKKE